MDFNDRETEDPYDAIECHVYINNEKIGTIFLVQSLNQTIRNRFPEVGTSFKTEFFNLQQYYTPVENYNVNFNKIIILE